MRRIPSSFLPLLLLVVAATLPVQASTRDDEITRKVTDDLNRSALVGHLALRAHSQDGKVTLQGKVRTLSEAWEAHEVASRTRGVLAIDDRFEIATAGRSDDATTTAVKRALADRPDLSRAAVKVRVQQGKVELTGSLDDARLRWVARSAAARVDGVVSIEDRLTSPPQPDDKVQQGARGVLGPGALTRISGRIHPEVRGGVVTLRGVVPRLYEREQAERLAMGVNGVLEVVNQLEIKPREPGRDIPLH